jgi:glycosyltransferase involved in cell wall biosynthesis
VNDNNVALLYDDDAFVETLRPTGAGGGPIGLMGRQVAGKEFLDTYLSHGSWDRLVAVVKARPRADSLVKMCKEHPSSAAKRRALKIVELGDFHTAFFPTPPAELLMLPGPLDDSFAWARQHAGPGAFALCGVTHTLCSLAGVEQLCRLVTGPYEPFDALICASRAVLEMVRAVTGAYADHLRERHGGEPKVRATMEVIPLGVDETRFRPATPAERATRRRSLQIEDDEVAVLFVGRLSHHAKAHPTPTYRGLSRAARLTGKKVHLLLCGWFSHQAVRQAFLDGARVLCPNVRVSVLDGTDANVRFGVWQAADVFTSLSDNVQETFGLVMLEAGASGLPVVASDWDGYRDLVEDGKTGLLVPTRMLPGATASATSRLLLGEVNYDNFLAECSQAAVVDVPAAAQAYARLIADAGLRRAMGEAARKHVVERFTWAGVIRQYEELWRRQRAECRAWREKHGGRRMPTWPACYPPPEHSFAGYPSAWMSESDRVRTADGAKGELEIIFRMPLTSHAAASRCQDLGVMRAALDAAMEGCALSVLDELFTGRGVSPSQARASVAWLLKHGLLEYAGGSS